MDANTRYIIVVCLAGILGLGVVFGIAALFDAPQRQKWHQLASLVGLKAETFGKTRLSGYSQSHYVIIERYLTPDPRNPGDAESGILWTRIVMTVKNAQQVTFIFGRSSVLNNIGGWFEKQFKNVTSLTLGDDKSPQSFFVKDSIPGLVESLLIRSGETLPALLATDGAYFIQLDGPRLSYTELGADVLDIPEIEKRARQLTFALSLLNEIAERIETYTPVLAGTRRDGR